MVKCVEGIFVQISADVFFMFSLIVYNRRNIFQDSVWKIDFYIHTHPPTCLSAYLPNYSYFLSDVCSIFSELLDLHVQVEVQVTGFV